MLSLLCLTWKEGRLKKLAQRATTMMSVNNQIIKHGYENQYASKIETQDRIPPFRMSGICYKMAPIWQAMAVLFNMGTLLHRSAAAGILPAVEPGRPARR